MTRMPSAISLRTLALALAASALPGLAAAQQDQVFNRIATFEVVKNLAPGRDAAKKTIAEIVAASADGNTLVYVDGEQKGIGFVDITDAAAPKAAGFLAMEGEPNSVTVSGARAFAVVATSSDKTKPAGYVAAVDLATRQIVGRCDLGGQPDSTTVSKDGRFLVTVIENERDEEKDKGKLPQLPAGDLVILPISASGLDCAGLKRVDLTGLAAVAPTDPEPEFVDVNSRGEAVVTLQENNHLAIVDLASAKVTAHFTAGTVNLDKIDAKRDGAIRPTQSLANVVREPDAVRWLDDNRFVTANEGDYENGSRGFTIFNRDGSVAWDSGNALEHIMMRLGHYPERRSGSRGNEPEGIDVGTFGGVQYIFVGSERSSAISVWRDRGAGQAPDFVQVLPTGTGPEGLLAIPSRNLFVTANEVDNPETGLRSSIVVYRLGAGPAAYPTIQSGDADGLPITWGALSGLSADPVTPGRLYGVTDSFYSDAKILTIDTTQTPARILAATVVTRDGKPAENLDLEGIAARPAGGFWLASEGNPERKEGALSDLLVRVGANGAVEEEIKLPEAITAHAIRFGFEGVAVTGEGASETVWLALQREWKDDPKGQVKLVSYKPATKEWGVVRYPLDAASAGWTGLSEITAAGNDTFVIIERNNQWSDKAVKRLFAVSLNGVTPAAPGSANIPVLTKRLVRDIVPDLAATKGIVLEKLEGFTIDKVGDAFAVTDNDGVDGTSGETQFLRLGKLSLGN